MIEYQEIEITNCLRVTEKAVLLEIDEEEVWIPFSQIEDNKEKITKGYEGVLFLSTWICDKNNIGY